MSIYGDDFSGISSASFGSAPTQLTLAASESFELNDPVFIDWKTGDIVNMNATPASPAIAAGPASTQMLMTDYNMSSGPGACVANALIMPDGSAVVCSGVLSQNGSYPTQGAAIYKYSKKGALLNRRLLAPFAQMATPAQLISLALLSNGNIAVSLILHNTGQMQVTWLILTPSLQIVATGSLTDSGTSGCFNLQPTNNGGFLAFSTGGITFISATGSAVAIVVAAGLMPAARADLNHNALSQDVSVCPSLANYRPVSLSNGGFGYFHWYSGSGVQFTQVNADGTLRGAPVLLAALTNSVQTFAVATSSTGNIAYAFSGVNQAGSYGIVSDSGAIIKAATLTGVPAQGALSLVSEASGGFVMLYSTDGATTYARCFTSTGVDRAGSPLQISATTGLSGSLLMRLSTGTVVLSPATYSFTFISNAGVITSTKKLVPIAPAVTGQVSAMVKDDVVYGVMNGGGATGNGAPEATVFSIKNTGDYSVQQLYLGITTTFPLSNIRLALDGTGRYMQLLCSYTYSGANQGWIVAVELESLYLSSIYSVGYSLSDSRIRTYGQAILATDGSRSFGYVVGNPGICALVIKPRPTILIGVAANAAEKGEALTVNTKGVFPLSDSWKRTALSFDHSVNFPPGNSGNINSGLINLKGI